MDDRTAKIGSALDAEETGVKYPDWAPVQCAQMITAEALLLPDGLEEAFGRRLRDFVECGGETALLTPAGVEAVVARGHANCFCAGRVAKSSAVVRARPRKGRQIEDEDEDDEEDGSKD